MGREIKRVPLDFDQPLNETWPGYLSPHWRDCPSPDCFNGSTTAGEWVHKMLYPVLMLDEAYLRGNNKLHPYLREHPLSPTRLREGGDYRSLHDYEPLPISADIVEFCTALAGREGSGGFGHDAIDHWQMDKAVLRGAGLPEDFFTCKVCKGAAIHPDDVEASEAWERTDPPEGEGWQMWETVSEGSPITPVFATAEGLVDHLVEHGDRPGRGGWRREAAESFVAAGWAPSFIGIEGVGLFRGAEDADRITEATK
jgi:hypothetical protein